MNDCARTSCPNPGRWHPVIVLRAPEIYGDTPPLRALLGLKICDKHKAGTALADYLSDEGWEQITAGVRQAGRIVPDRTLTTLDWSHVLSGEAAKFREHFVSKGIPP